MPANLHLAVQICKNSAAENANLQQLQICKSCKSCKFAKPAAPKMHMCIVANMCAHKLLQTCVGLFNCAPCSRARSLLFNWLCGQPPVTQMCYCRPVNLSSLLVCACQAFCQLADVPAGLQPKAIPCSPTQTRPAPPQPRRALVQILSDEKYFKSVCVRTFKVHFALPPYNWIS